MPANRVQVVAAPAAKTKPKAGEGESDFKVVTVNRQARHDYSILEVVEAGMALTGSEIKSIRAGKVQLRDAYARRSRDEMWLYGLHIALYPDATYNNHEPERPRKLLLHKSQIIDLADALEAKGLTLIPLRIYLKHHRAKVELGLARGRTKYDKRAAIAKRESDADLRAAMSAKRR